MSEESIEDAPSMTAFLNKKVPEKMAFAINYAIVQGNGAGKPLGIMNSPALVSVAKETGQLADTLETANLLKMYSRMYGPSRSRAVWLINQDIEPQLFQLTMGTNSMPVYLPPNGLAQAPFATIMGRPVIPTQACETIGDQGDIIFADLSQYMTVTKTNGGVRQEVSMHLWFDQDMLAFKFVFRVGGQPWWSAAVSPRDGSNTLSPFVTLDAR
jgi:HK97 family phage major capsid protein